MRRELVARRCGHAFDLQVFFPWTTKKPAAITTRDVVAVLAFQRRGNSTVATIADRGSGCRREQWLAGSLASALLLLSRGPGDAGVHANPFAEGWPSAGPDAPEDGKHR